MNKENCDPVTGVCTPADLAGEETTQPLREDVEIIYVGDPMCSWCWGISKDLRSLRDYYLPKGIPFKIIVGGLAPGGRDYKWNEEFKNFLRHHWEEVTKRSGQPFGNTLFYLDDFTYDTEPSCRAVVAAREWIGEKELEFFEAVQRKFYVDNEDPKKDEFYKSICKTFELDFESFKKAFNTEEAKRNTHQEFVLNREWGVRGYPSLLFRDKNQLSYIANGYATFDQMKERVELVLE